MAEGDLNCWELESPGGFFTDRSSTKAGVAKIQPLYPGTELNLGDRILGEVEKNRFIALPSKGGLRGIMPSKLCVLNWRG